MNKPVDRLKQTRWELAQVDRRSWHLLGLSIGVSVLLALGIAAFFYPAIKWRIYAYDTRIGGILPQLVLGLLALVMLGAAHIITKQRELNEVRSFIMATYVTAGAELGAPDFAKDPLTGVLDRRALPEVLKRESTWVDRYRIPLCLTLLDIRDFSKINERDGNMAGDIVLKEFAQVIQVTMRQTDSLLRYGADEFLCLLPRTDQGGGAAFVRRVLQACQNSARLRGIEVDPGLAVYRAGADVNQVLAEAEHALAAQKGTISLPRD